MLQLSSRQVMKSSMYVLNRKHYAIKYVPVHDYTIYNETYSDLVERLTQVHVKHCPEHNYSKIIDELKKNKNMLEPFVYP